MRCYQEYTPKDIVVIAEQGKECPKYQRVIEEIEEGMKIPEIDKESPSREIKNKWKNAIIRVLEDGNKLIYFSCCRVVFLYIFLYILYIVNR